MARPQDPGWLDAYAETLAAVHQVPRRRSDLPVDPGAARPWLDGEPPVGLGPLHDRLWLAIGRRRAELGTVPHVLVHGDFHAGNVHWMRGRVSGVIDWEMARWGPAAADVAYALAGYCGLTPTLLRRRLGRLVRALV